MEPRFSKVDGTDIVIVEAPQVIIRDAQDALDLLASVSYHHQCHKAVLDKALFPEEFFQLRTGLAGEVLQKFTNYGFAVAIVGDFSIYESKALKDFIYECNKGRQVCFAPDRQSAVDFLSRV